jgi:hypothetical protein
MKKETWWWRNTVMWSPFRINSWLSIDEIQSEIEKIFRKPNLWRNIKWDFQKIKEFTKENIVNFFSLDEWVIELDNWDLLFNDYWKYRPNITLLTSKKDYFTRWKNFYWNLETEEILDTKQVCEKFNIENYGNSLSAISWDYWKSKKWTNCFRAKKAWKHYLIIEDWGWSFWKWRGWSFEALKDQILYSRKASSNWGWNGYSYAIVAKNARVKLSIEDI